MALPTNLTVQQLVGQRDALILALTNSTKSVTFADGRRQEYQDISEMQTALETIETILGSMTGQTGSRVALAQHKRGDGPHGPDRLYW